MTKPSVWQAPTGRKIAYHLTEGKGPLVVFLGGFMSDMSGSKAIYLQKWAARSGRAFLRFDYSGHGVSEGAFVDGAIGDWYADAEGLIAHVSSGPVVLVGSSMGGWISFLIARAGLVDVVGMVTIAAAPDFTEDGFFASFDAPTREILDREGVVHVPSDYGAPYPITKRLIEDGRNHLVMRQPLGLPFAVRMVQGTEDASVTRETALGLLDHVSCEDVRLMLVRGKNHSFSDDDCLKIIEQQIEDVLGLAGV